MERAIIKKDGQTELIILRGIEPRDEKQVTTVAQKIKKGTFLAENNQNNLVIGETLAAELDIEVGDSISTAFSNGKRDEFSVTGIYYTGLRDLDRGGYTLLQKLQTDLGLENQISEIAIRLTDGNKTDVFKKIINQELQGKELTIESWQDRMAFINQMQRNLNIVQTMIIILAIIAAGIATTVLMYTNVLHKTRIIGILKAIGANNNDILILFIIEGIILGIAGAMVGNILGSGIDLFLIHYPIKITMGVSEGAATTIPITTIFSFSYLIVPSISTIVITLLASFYPAWRAS